MAIIYVNKAGNEINKETYDKLNENLKGRYSRKNAPVKTPQEATPEKTSGKKDSK